ncbi:sigma-54-dependent transcriptional regulator FlbD [Sneathiella chinensis]|uniref:Sigma-54-dependent Fis family transcriptional regulator n=1 Tax=Sneathiella chinensis TaxID=349750 RepID=A0ABQ5U5T6_9PROT|nr:sigma-54 dependent transcriptional regulator [Sneathiella chinensis]GLQ05846.1 sigma-54-dependent Fis family transcriptional regulator [Sneathiella chinensis]
MRLLIVGSLDGQIGAASQIAMSRGAKVSQVNDIEMALSSLRSGKGADMAMIDVNLPISSFVESLANERINLPIIACGVNTDATAAANAIRAGAKEFLPLPPDPELIAAVLEAVAQENTNLVFKDPAMQAAVSLAEQIAPSTASVLINGETGTGKEVMASFLHAKSSRSDKPFVCVNCAAIPENLLESELFGHEKGAFTGAVARRIGKFEEANGGTLLLDEISEMDIQLQAKLLRAIQERVIDRVGGTKPVPVDIRILATSNRDLAEAVREKTFREDLLFRLNVVTLKIPPLRERPADIEALADYFNKKYSDMNGIALKPISEAALNKLKINPWQGNVRELENTMHRAVLLAQGTEIGPEAILMPDGTSIPEASPAQAAPAAAAMPGTGLPAGTPADTVDASIPLVGRTVADVEKDLILNTLEHCLGNRTHAANILGISIRTLRNKLKLYSDDGVAIPTPGSNQRASI